MARTPRNVGPASFLIFSEGTKGEPGYFRCPDFRTVRFAPIINPIHEGTGTESLKKSVNSYKERIGIEKDDRVWIVLDSDNREDEELHNLFSWATKNRYRIALSNPCFKLWLALHIGYLCSNMNHNDLIAFLKKNIEGHEKNKQLCAEFSARRDGAVKNAVRLRGTIGSEPKWKNNPYTNVDELIADLLEYLKERPAGPSRGRRKNSARG